MDLIVLSKLERMKLELEIFKESNYKMSDAEIASVMKKMGYQTSSSTVGRDLVNLALLTFISEDEWNFIKNQRTVNKYMGEIKGGINSQNNNIQIKDKLGKFTGRVLKK